jgi:hypothetical protein
VDTNDNEDAVTQYQLTIKMFYNIAIMACFNYSLEHKLPLTFFAKRMNTCYHTLCKMTNDWREDEQYKSDPRWNS